MKSKICSLLIALVLFGSTGTETNAHKNNQPCGTSGVRGTISTHAPLLTQIAGGTTYVCNDGSLLALGNSLTPRNDWWRIATKKTSWKNPLVTACVVPIASTARTYEAWYNILGIHTPYNSDELNYLTSYRHDGKLITKKEVVDYTNITPYRSITSGIVPNTRVAMAVSRVVDKNGHSTVRTWIQPGSCVVDTSKAPQIVGKDTANPNITDGRVALRTDFLLHQVVSWNVCEARGDGRSCATTPQQLVPVIQ